MGRIYSASFEAVSVAAVQDIFSLTVAAGNPIRLLGCFLSQHTDTGDSNEEQLRLAITRGLGTVGSGGSALTARALDSTDPTAQTTARSNDTTQASAGSAQLMHAESWNTRQTWIYLPPPELVIRVDSADDIIVIELQAAPSAAINMNGTIYWEEI